MPFPSQTMLDQDAVLWEYVRLDNEGQPMVKQAVQLDVRWEFKAGQAVDPQGKVIAIDATVMVDREIPIDSIMWKGLIADFPGQGGLMQVKTYNNTPSANGRDETIVLGLVRYRNKLPRFA